MDILLSSPLPTLDSFLCSQLSTSNSRLISPPRLWPTMLTLFGSRLLTLLQFTRMALVFTAISNGWAALLLRARMATPAGGSMSDHFDYRWAVAMTAVSVGLYGFGMTLNDIIDRRRDAATAAHRPLPSGRLRVRTARGVCVALGVLALGGAGYLASSMPGGWLSLVVCCVTFMLILFYDLAGKYLVALGLLSLGTIRFMQATVAAPTLPLVWHPLTLLVHVTLLSAVCYAWEGKRPLLTRKHWGLLLAGLGAVVALALACVVQWRADWQSALALRPALLYPLGVGFAFVAFAAWTRRTTPDSRTAGRATMLYGLLWLILYDAAFLFGYVGWPAALAVLLLLPVAYFCVQLMRWWGRLLELSVKPEYQRAQ